MKQELQHKYILIHDKSGIQNNLWKITAIDNKNYIIMCRTTRRYIPISLTFEVAGSDVLRTNFKLDVNQSDIELTNCGETFNKQCLSCGFCNRQKYCTLKNNYIYNIITYNDCWCYRNKRTFRVEERWQDDLGYMENETNESWDLAFGVDEY